MRKSCHDRGGVLEILASYLDFGMAVSARDCQFDVQRLSEPLSSGRDKGCVEKQPLYLSLGAESGEERSDLVSL